MRAVIKKIPFLILLTVFGVSQFAYAQPGFGSAKKLNDGWQFTLDSEDSSALNPTTGAKWLQVDLPHDWSVKQKLDPKNASCMGYLPGGIGWYRKKIHISKQAGRAYLYFEGVYNRSEVFVNGTSVGKRPNGYISFIYDITPFVRFDQDNEILVKVDHHRAADSRWYTGSGIYRDVWLVYANPVHIVEWGVYAWPQLQGNKGLMHIEVNLKNENRGAEQVSLINQLLDRKGKIIATDTQPVTIQPGTESRVQTKLNVSNPELWSLNKPVLYQLKTKVIRNGKIVDETTTTTGFRSFAFDPGKGFALNSQWMKVKGVCIHHDAGVLGAAFYKDVWRQRLLTLKAIGVNAIRTSHNPQAPAFYALCDELGFLVIDEAFDEWEYPKRKWLEGWNVGKPGFEGSYDFFESWGGKDLGDMVRRDRNHLSVFAWSIGNEVDYPNDPYSHPVLNGSAESGFTQKIFGGYKKEAPDANRLGIIAKRLAAVVKEFDRTRPVTAGLAGVAMSNETDYPAALDIAGYNYTENRYLSDHKKYPYRVIYGSENRHDLSAWKSGTNNSFIFGQFLWTGIDYLGESGRWPSRGFYSGLMDFAGFIKPRGYFRQSLWSDKPMAYLGTYPTPGKNAGGQRQSDDVLTQSENREEKVPSMDAWSYWHYTEGQSVRVVCYTNAQKARLSLNGKQVGETKYYDDQTGIIYWDIPYHPGTLRVEGLSNTGKVISAYEIKTPGKPFAIQQIKSGTDNKQKGVERIALQVVDQLGNPVDTAEVEITCTITGHSTLLGLEAGNNRDMGDYTDNKQHTFRGKLVAYIKRSGDAKSVRASFSSPGMKTLVVDL